MIFGIIYFRFIKVPAQRLVDHSLSALTCILSELLQPVEQIFLNLKINLPSTVHH